MAGGYVPPSTTTTAPHEEGTDRLAPGPGGSWCLQVRVKIPGSSPHPKRLIAGKRNTKQAWGTSLPTFTSDVTHLFGGTHLTADTAERNAPCVRAKSSGRATRTLHGTTLYSHQVILQAHAHTRRLAARFWLAKICDEK